MEICGAAAAIDALDRNSISVMCANSNNINNKYDKIKTYVQYRG